MFLHDLRHAARGLAGRPGFTAIAVVTLALGIGANSVIFSWIDATLLHPLPGIADARSLVALYGTERARNNISLSYPNYVDLREATVPGVRSVAAFSAGALGVRTDDGTERVWGAVVSGNLFETLGVGAALVAASVVVSTFGCNVAAIISSSRTAFAMAADGRFFPAAAKVHPVYRTPHVAILITSVWSAFLTLTGGYETLFTYVTFASVLFGTLGGVAIFVLRVKKPDVPRPYRALGYPVIPALYVLGSLALVINTLLERPGASIAGLGLVALGLPFYFHWAGKSRKAAPEARG